MPKFLWKVDVVFSDALGQLTSTTSARMRRQEFKPRELSPNLIRTRACLQVHPRACVPDLKRAPHIF